MVSLATKSGVTWRKIAGVRGGERTRRWKGRLSLVPAPRDQPALPNPPPALLNPPSAPATPHTAPTPLPARAEPLPAPARDPRWMAEFMKQATTRLRQRAVRFAQHRARLVEYNGGRGDAAYVEDTVEDVFVDTLSGVLAWDPAKGKLSAHIFLALRSRIRHDMDRAEAQPHASIEALDETLLEVESALAETTPASNAEDAMLCAQIIAQVRARAADDPGISKLLDGMCTGHLDRGALMRATGMSARDYDATRKRLDRLLAELPLNGARRVRPDQCHDHIDAD